MKLVTCLPLVLVLLSVGKGHMVSKRQAEQQNQPAGNSFHLFGQILGGLARLFGTAVEEGGNFLARQAEVNQPVVETVVNISKLVCSELGSSVWHGSGGGGQLFGKAGRGEPARGGDRGEHLQHDRAV